MINKVLLGLIVAVAVSVVVVGSTDKARQQPAAAITALSETVDTPITGDALKGDTSISTSANLSTFVSLAEAIGLVDMLKEKGGEYTIFAPTNAAFETFAKGGVDALLASETKSSLTALMTYHVVPGHYSPKELTDGLVLTTVEGDTLTVSNVKGVITINGVAVVTSSETTVDGSLVHIVNHVLTSSTDGLMTETTGPVKGESVVDVTEGTVCTDNGDGTITLQTQEYGGWWIFTGWHNKGDAITQKGSCWSTVDPKEVGSTDGVPTIEKRQPRYRTLCVDNNNPPPAAYLYQQVQNPIWPFFWGGWHDDGTAPVGQGASCSTAGGGSMEA